MIGTTYIFNYLGDSPQFSQPVSPKWPRVTPFIPYYFSIYGNHPILEISTMQSYYLNHDKAWANFYLHYASSCAINIHKIRLPLPTLRATILYLTDQSNRANTTMSSFILYEPFHFEVERLLNDSLSQQSKTRRNGARCSVRSFKSRVDIHEDSEKNLTTATFEFPGLSKDNVQLNFQNSKLTVSAESKKSEERADTGYTLRERLRGKLSCSFQLPQGVQDERIKATMENGFLTVTFPKTLPELAPKKIAISDL